MLSTRYLSVTICSLFLLIAFPLFSQSSSFQLGSLSERINSVITDERVRTVPFKDGVLIFSGERSKSFIYYFDGEAPPVLIGEAGGYTVDVGALPGGRVVSSLLSPFSFSERRLLFISEEDFSLTTLDHPFLNGYPQTVAFADFILQFNTVPGDSLVITRIGGQPVRSTEIMRVEAFNNTNNPSYRELEGRVIISTLDESFLTDGTAIGTHVLPNHGGRSAYSVHFFDGEYYYWDKVFKEIVAMDPTTGTVRRFMETDFPSSLIPLAITDMTVTPEGVVYIAQTDEYSYGLFFTDGTVEGSRLLRSFSGIYGFGGTPRSLDRNAPHPNGALIFLVEGASGTFDELWQSDGTEASTKKIRNIPPGASNFTLAGIGRYDTAHSYFYTTIRYESSNVRQLYGTKLDGDVPEFKLLEPDSVDLQSVTDYVADEGWFLYSNPLDTTIGMRAYRLGDNLRVHYPDSPKPSLATKPLFVNDQAYLLVETSENGEEPGVLTLGEEAITLLADVFPGTTSSKPHFFSIGEFVFFLANNADSGYGIYRTDGTQLGTNFYLDLHDRNDPQFLRQIRRIGDDLLAAENGFYKRLLNQEQDSLENLSSSNFYLTDESIQGFFAFSYPLDGDLEIVSRSERFTLEAIFPAQWRVTKPVVHGNEFVFLMSHTFNEWSLAFINPVTRTGRSLPLGDELTCDWSFNGMFSTGEALYFYAEDTSGVKPIIRYDEVSGLQRTSEALSSVESISRVETGLKGHNRLIRARASGVGYSYWLHNEATDSLIYQGLYLTEEVIRGLVTFPNRLLLMTDEQLYLSTSDTDLTPSPGGVLLDETASDFRLSSLTYLFEDEMFFVRSDYTTTELWKTDGTLGGTRKIAAVDGRPYFSPAGTLPQIQNWFLQNTFNGEQTTFLLYNYQNGAVAKIHSNLTYQVEGLGNRFYFIDDLEAGGQNIFYLEEVEGQGADGTVYEDANRNGIQDPDEHGINGQKVRFRSLTEDILTFSNVEGKYPRFYQAGGNYEMVVEPDVCWEPTTDSLVVLNDSLSTPLFGLANRTEANGISANVFASTLRCGFDVPFWLVVSNTGCQPLTNIEVGFSLDDGATFLSADLPPVEIEMSKLSWANIDLPAGASWKVRMLLTMPDETREGTLVPFALEANGLSNQGVGVMDTFAYNQTLRCAIDPNDKLVSPVCQEETNSNYTQVDETLTYTIRFQNTGNDTAFNVRLEDQLAEELDLATFKPLAASHNFRVALEGTGRLKVYFDDIFLPDSNVNETLSHGFFAFEIALKETGIDSIVENTAGIFFDFNAPVITNTVSSSVVEFLDEDQDHFFFWEECDDQNPQINPAVLDIGGNGIDEDCDGEDWTTAIRNSLPGTLNLFPNPTAGKIEIQYSLDEQLLVTVFDGSGRSMQTKRLKSNGQLDLSDLPAAVYHIRLMEVVSGRFSSWRVMKSNR